MQKLAIALIAGVDISLCAGDQARIKMEEARQLMTTSEGIITCKGRRGGKRRHLALHQRTRAPLKAYLAEREELA